MQRFRYKKTKAKQAQAKLTQIQRLDQERRAASDEAALLTRRSRKLGFGFSHPPRSGRIVLETEGLDPADRRAELVEGVGVALERGEHVALVGPNGSGKTTFLETVLGRRPLQEGRTKLGHGVVPAYFSQQEVELDLTKTVLDCTQAATGLSRPQAQNLLGRFLFSGWDAHEKQVAVLSGGERRRLALAHVVASGANFLVLDEPTNHLDLESREALEAALEDFPGTVLLVSHDRALLDAVAERTLAIEDGADRLLRRRLGRPAARASRARGKRRSPSSPSRRGRRSRSRAPAASRRSSSASRRRSRAAKPRSPSSSGSSRRTGRTSTSSRRTARRATELESLLARWETLFDEAST